MESIDYIRWSLQAPDAGFGSLIDDLQDHPLHAPTANGGNHAIWILGHLAFIEAELPWILFGEPNVLKHWAPLFAPGTTPTPSASNYPNFDEVRTAFRDQRSRTLQLLEEIGDERLSEIPANIPKGFENAMATFGQTLLLMALHQMLHYGQITDIRRSLGLAPRR